MRQAENRQHLSDITIRAGRSADLPRLRQLYIEMTAYHAERDARYADAETATREAAHFFEGWLRHSRALLAVAEINGNVAGFGLISLQKPHMAMANIPTARLDLLAVGANFRRRGIGTQIVNALIEWARSQGAERVFVSHAAQNPAASAFWSSFGFVDFAVVRSLDIK